MIVEGSGILLSNRYRPEFLYKETKIRSTHGRIYAFTDYSEYQERILGRSGYTIESTAMWTKNKGFALYMEKYPMELDLIGRPADADYTIDLVPWNAPVTDQGELILKDLGLDPAPFLEWSKENDFAKQFVLSAAPKKGFF
jgi:hypothetical protein